MYDIYMLNIHTLQVLAHARNGNRAVIYLLLVINALFFMLICFTSSQSFSVAPQPQTKTKRIVVEEAYLCTRQSYFN